MTRGSHQRDRVSAKRTLMFEKDSKNPLHTETSQHEPVPDEPIQGNTAGAKIGSPYKDRKVKPDSDEPLFLPASSSEGFGARSSPQSVSTKSTRSRRDTFPLLDIFNDIPRRDQLSSRSTLTPRISVANKKETSQEIKTSSRKQKRRKKVTDEKPALTLNMQAQFLKCNGEVSAAVSGSKSQPVQEGGPMPYIDATNRYHTKSKVNNRTLLHNRNAILSTVTPQDKGKGRKRKNTSFTEPEGRKRQRENYH